MAKIMLISPAYVDLYGELNRAAGRYFPLGLGYIAAYLRKYGGHSVRLYEPEAQKLTYRDIALIIKDFKPDIIGLTSATPNFPRALDLARLGRDNSNAVIVLGGVHASAIPEFIAEEYQQLIDYVVVGEGEITMLELVDSIMSGKSCDNIPGLVYLKNNKLVKTVCRPYINDLDSIPFPARDLIPQILFAPNLHNARHKNCSSILTSRGCPFNCSFCASRLVSGGKYRVHSSEYVLEEMKMLVRDYNAKQLLITDDTFTINRERLEKICVGMINSKLNLEWFCFSQVTTVDKDILRLMKKAGCYSIGFGIESAEESILKWMGKPIKPERALKAVHDANEVGLKTQAFYVFGSPGETISQMEHTVNFASEVDAVLTFFNMLVPYPGTKEFNYYFANTPLKNIDWTNFVAIGETCVLDKSSVSAKDIEHLIARANRDYYLNPRRLLRLLWHIRTSYELFNYVNGGISLLHQIGKWMSEVHEKRTDSK